MKEQPLPPLGSCLLGSINLTKFIDDPFKESAIFDKDKFSKVIRIFTRMLDNVVDLSNLPLKRQEEEIKRKRRHGMGYTGLGSAMVMLGYSYGSEESIEFTEMVTKILAVTGWEVGVELAIEKGPAPIFLEDDIDDISVKQLFTESSYMQKIFDASPGLKDKMLNYGCRFTHHTSIAPCGTISLSIGNNISNGIEPSFTHSYLRNVIDENSKSKVQSPVYSYEYLLYQHLINPDAAVGELPDCFIDSNKITPIQHIKIQAAAQKWIDSSISKCVVAGTRLITNQGLLPIEDMGYARDDDSFEKPLEGLEVLCPDGAYRKVINHYCGGDKNTIKVTFSNGQVLEGSLVHKVMTNQGWKRLSELSTESVILAKRLIEYNHDGGNTLLLEIPDDDLDDSIKLPTKMSVELAKLLGVCSVIGKLSYHHSTVSQSFNSSDIGIINWVKDTVTSLFGDQLPIDVRTYNHEHYLTIGSHLVSKWLASLNGVYHSNISIACEDVMSGSKEEMVGYLKGLSLKLEEGAEVPKNITVYTEKHARDIFSLYIALGFSPDIVTRYCSNNERYVWIIDTNVDQGESFLVPASSINMVEPGDDNPLKSWIEDMKGDSNRLTIMSHDLDAVGADYDPNFRALTIDKIERGHSKVYDIEVADTHDYLIDGIWSHNTINVPTDFPFEDFKDLYMEAYDHKLKGVTTFRFNPEVFSGVLVKEEDLASTTYAFELEDGEVVHVKGNEEIAYDGETHNAANLHDAIKEGYYGKL